MKKILAALAALFVAFSAPASALNRTTMYYGLQPPNSWLNLSNRDIRLGFGQFIYDALGGTSSVYSNLLITPVTGLYVAVGPAVGSQQGSLYQFLQDDANPWGGIVGTGGITQLPADPTLVMIQGLLNSNSANIGPLTAGTSAGQSVNNLIECQISTVDATPTTVNTVTSVGVVGSTTANRDRNDTIVCQNKPGTSATTGSQTTPTADTGWLGIGYVAVANGTATITSGMVTMNPAFTGFSRSGGAGGYAVLSATQTFTGANTFSASASTVPVSIVAAASQSADLFDIWNNGSTTRYLWVDSTGALHESGAIAMGGALTGATTGSFSGAVTGSNFATSNTTYGAGSITGTFGALNISGNTSSYIREYLGSSATNFGVLDLYNSAGNVIEIFGGGTAVTGVTGTELNIDRFGGSTYLALDGSGNMGLLGTLKLGSPLGVAYGGTGSASQNFVDLSSTQTVGGAKTFSAGLVSSVGSNWLVASNGGTSAIWQTAQNTGGNLYEGIESSVGSSIFSGGSAYAGVIGTTAGRPFQIATNNTVVATFASGGGLTLTGGLAISGALTGATSMTLTGLMTSVGMTAGTGTIQGSSNGSTVAYHAPIYTAGGAATASTEHIVRGSATCTISSGGTCFISVPLTGAAQFSSSTSYYIVVSLNDVSGGVLSTAAASITAQTATAFTLSVGGGGANGNVAVFNYEAIGT